VVSGDNELNLNVFTPDLGPAPPERAYLTASITTDHADPM
jgi:hypothetical protein